MAPLRVLVIGLDGASFNLIGPWLKKKVLANLADIVKNGVSGPLESWLPPVTCPCWKCYSTGLNPGKLGVYWWQMVDVERRRIQTPNSRSFHGKEIWDYLSEAGFSSGVLNMPTTYPPKPVRGFLVSGGPMALEFNYTYPARLERRLKRIGYKVHPDAQMITQEYIKEHFDEFLKLFELRFKVAYKLANEFNVDFLHITIFYINVLHHFLWDHPLVRKAWEFIDDLIGWILSAWSPDDLIILSDHGSGPIRGVFAINAWLRAQGYLHLGHKGTKKLFVRLGITRERLGALLPISLLDRLRRFRVKSVFRSLLPPAVGDIDWDSSKVIGLGQGPVYLIGVSRNTPDYEALREELIRRLEALRNPRTGESIIVRAHRAEELYGTLRGLAPDIILEPAPGYHIEGNVAAKKVLDEPDRWVAENAKYGIFVFHGDHFKKGLRVHGVRITDIAPTVLRLFGIEAPKHLDGRPLIDFLAGR